MKPFVRSVCCLALLAAILPARSFEVRIRLGDGGSIVLDWASQPGARYEVLWNPDFSTSVSSWNVLEDVTALNATSTVTDHGGTARPHPAEAPSRFYLIREVGSIQGQPTPLLADVAFSTVLTAERSPYVVTNQIRVLPGATLTIEPGVEVRGAGTAAFRVEGALRALGTPTRPVLFTSRDPFGQPGDWTGLFFAPSSDDGACVLSNVVVEFAQRGVSCLEASPTLQSVQVRRCSDHGIYLERSSPLIEGGRIEQNARSGIYCKDLSSPRILSNRIWGNGTTGIELTSPTDRDLNCRPVIEGNQLLQNGLFALRANACFDPSATFINARSNWWGTSDFQAIRTAIYDYSDLNRAPFVDYGNWLMTAAGPAKEGHFVQGFIREPTTWRLADSPINVVAHLQVTNTGTLTIEPGVRVQFLGNFHLEIASVLRAQGTVAAPIRFTSGVEGPWPGDWVGLRFLGGSDDASCVLSNTVVEFATRGVSCLSASPTLVDSRFEQNSQHGLYLENASPLIQRNVVQNNGDSGIYGRLRSSPRVLNNTIWGNANSGVEFVGATSANENSYPILRRNSFYRNRRFALEMGNYHQPSQAQIDARENWWGTADYAGIVVLIYDHWDNTSMPLVDISNWLNGAAGSPVSGNYVQGYVSSNVVWRAADSPLFALGHLTVMTNGSLTIEPGVELRFLGDHRLLVEGALAVLGRPDAPVVFTSDRPNPAPNDWKGLRFADASVDALCVLSNVTIQFANRGVECFGASPTLVDCRIAQSYDHGIYLEQSSPLIRQCTIVSNRADGIQCRLSSMPQILNCQIESNGSDAIELTGSTTQNQNSLPLILGNSLAGNAGLSVRSGNYFNARQTRINARSNWWGVVDVPGIHTRIYDQSDNSQAPVVDFGNWLTGPGSEAVAGFFIYGKLDQDTLWRVVDSPIGLIGATHVETNVTLTIEPGVEITAHGDFPLDVSGSLHALGSATAPIVFTSARPLPKAKDWDGLRFHDASVDANCVLSNTLIEFAEIAITCSNASPTIVGCQLRDNDIGIYLDTASPDILRNLIEFNRLGIDCYQRSNPRMVANTIAVNQQHGLQVRGSSTSTDRNPYPLLIGNSLFDNGAAGRGYYDLHASSFYGPATNVVTAISNWWGSISTNTLADRIYDRVDSPGSPRVQYQPYLDTNPNFTPYGARNSARWFSPNGDGNLDQITIQGFLPTAGNWTVSLVNDQGTTVRRLAGTGVTISETWGGTSDGGSTVPDGRYRTVVLATNSSDGTVNRAWGDASLVDRTAPISLARFNALPDGAIVNDLIVQGTGNDAVLRYWKLDYGPGTPGGFTLIASNTTPVVNGLLGTLNTRSLTNGNYTFRLQTADYAGNIGLTQWIARVDNLVLSGADIDSPFFDPPLQSAEMVFSIDRPSQITLSVVPIQTRIDFMGSVDVSYGQTPVRTISRTLNAGLQSIQWDGRDQAGNLAEPGVYGFLLQAEAADGRAASYAPVYVPGPVTASQVSVGTNFNFVANELLPISYQLFAPAFVFLAVPNQPYPIVWGEPQPAGPHTSWWDGRSSADGSLYVGTFTIALKTQILPENAVVVFHPVGTLIADVQSEAYLIHPSYSQISEVHFRLQRDADVLVRLRDPNGNYIVLQEERRRSAGPHVIEWNGQYDPGRIVGTEGDYQISVSALDPLTGIRETRTANLSIR